jgi:hypothetical protein
LLCRGWLRRGDVSATHSHYKNKIFCLTKRRMEGAGAGGDI